jgi:hypothetical protein
VVIHDRANDGTSAEADTMIAEFPDATCAPQQASTYAVAMGKARDAFKALVKRCTGYQIGSTYSLVTLDGRGVKCTGLIGI